MNKVTLNISISLDGYVAGVNDSQEQPLGEGASALHSWMFSGEERSEVSSFFKLSNIDKHVFDSAAKETGAMVVGRKTYNIVNGWGGSHPLENIPVFVVTHRIPAEIPKGTTPITFITGGVEQAVQQAKQAAGEKVVSIGTASIAQQCIELDLLDEIQLHIAPIVLGKGVRLFEHIGKKTIALNSKELIEGTEVIHIKYEVIK